MTAADDVVTAGLLLPPPGEPLATGWEADLPVHDSVVRNYAATLRDRLQTSVACVGGRVERVAGGLLVDLGSAYVFDNVALCDGFLDDRQLSALVAAAHAFYPADRSWTLVTLDPRTDLRPAGLELIGHPPLMYRAAGGTGPPDPDAVEIVRVTTPAQVEDFGRTLVAAYPLPGGAAAIDERVLSAGPRAWVAYVDGEPVATAGSHTAHGLTEVEWVSTLDGYRRRGIGAAVTWRATVADPTRPAVLLATDAGRPLYERLGYVAVIRLTMWLRP